MTNCNSTASRRFTTWFYAYSFLKEFVPIYPVYLVLFGARGLSVLQISLLLIIWQVPVIALEVPSGVWADRWSRKQMLVIGAAAKLLCMVAWTLAHGFAFFALGFVFWGVQSAFCSGTTEALLYDNLEQFGRRDDYERVAGIGHFYRRIAVTISMLLGGVIAAVNMDLVLVLSIITTTTTLLVTLMIEECQHSAVPDRTSYLDTLRAGAKSCLGSWPIARIMVYTALVLGSAGVLDEYDQLYAQWVGLPLGLIGAWGAVRYGLEALGSRFAYRLSSLFDRPIGRYSISLAAGCCLLASVIYRSFWLLPLYAAFYMITSAGSVLTEAALQREIDTAERATITSFSSLVYELFCIGLYYVFGLAAEMGGLRIGIGVFGVMVIVYSVGALLVARGRLAVVTDGA
ncbi:MAG: MFS transporter [Bacillota bacterium]